MAVGRLQQVGFGIDIISIHWCLFSRPQALPGTKVRRTDVTTWGNKLLGWILAGKYFVLVGRVQQFHHVAVQLRIDWLPNPSNGIIHGFGFGQSDFMWHLRQLPKVKDAVGRVGIVGMSTPFEASLPLPIWAKLVKHGRRCGVAWHRIVQESFAAIWGTEDLLVSFDGGNIFRPWRYNPEWLTTGGDFKKG